MAQKQWLRLCAAEVEEAESVPAASAVFLMEAKNGNTRASRFWRRLKIPGYSQTYSGARRYDAPVYLQCVKPSFSGNFQTWKCRWKTIVFCSPCLIAPSPVSSTCPSRFCLPFTSSYYECNRRFLNPIFPCSHCSLPSLRTLFFILPGEAPPDIFCCSVHLYLDCLRPRC